MPWPAMARHGRLSASVSIARVRTPPELEDLPGYQAPHKCSDSIVFIHQGLVSRRDSMMACTPESSQAGYDK